MDDKNFDLPKVNNEEENNIPQEKPLIEIPQEYYDKLEKEKKEKEAQAIEQEKIDKENAEASEKSNKILIGSILSAIVFIVLLYIMINKNKLFIIGIPIYIILYSLINASAEKEESTGPMSILIGGIISTILCFIGSIVTKENIAEFCSYGIVASIVTAFVGVIISSVTTKMITNKGKTKALGTLGYLLFFAIIFVGPYFAYKKFPEQVLKYVFNEKNAIVATTEEEYIVKTLKNRYGSEFKCRDNEAKKIMDESNNMGTIRTCTDSSGLELTVKSFPYSVNNVEYVIIDDYAKQKVLSKLKEELSEQIQLTTNAKAVAISTYPKSFCAFVGDCVENDQFIKDYEKENTLKNQYEFSKSLDLKKYIKETPQEFANDLGFGYSITLYGNYSSLIDSKHEETVKSVLNTLNSSGYKNKNGYIIILKEDDSFKQVVYKVEGKASSDETFKDPVIK